MNLRLAAATATATAVATTCVLGLIASPRAEAGADYCHTTESGAYTCIQSVFGPRNDRGIVYTVNGYVYATRINCYNYNYEKTSLNAVACWAYERISQQPPANLQQLMEAGKSTQRLMSISGIADKSNVITPEKINRALPTELK